MPTETDVEANSVTEATKPETKSTAKLRLKVLSAISVGLLVIGIIGVSVGSVGTAVELTADSCDAVRTVSSDARRLFLEYRLAIVGAYCVLINLLADIARRQCARLPMWPHVSEAHRFEMPTRIVRCLIIGPLLLLAFPTLVFNATTGCDASEIFFFWVGSLVPVFDLHELIRAWPLRPSLALHHIATLTYCLFFTDFQVMPPPTGIDALLIWFFGLMSFQWTSDIFYGMFRFTVCKWKVRLACRVARMNGVAKAAQVGLLFALAVKGLTVEQRCWRNPTRLFSFEFCPWATSLVAAFMCVAFAYEHTLGQIWTWRFDVDEYFAQHQDKILGKQHQHPQQAASPPLAPVPPRCDDVCDVSSV